MGFKPTLNCHRAHYSVSNCHVPNTVDSVDIFGGEPMERRTMKRGEKYDIEERIKGGDWQPICECYSIEEAKEILKNLRTLDGEEANETQE